MQQLLWNRFQNQVQIFTIWQLVHKHFATSTGGDSRTQFEGTDVSPLTPVDSVSDEFYFFDDVIAA